MQSDIIKIMQARAIDRVATQCLADGECSFDDYAFYNFSRQVCASILNFFFLLPISMRPCTVPNFLQGH